MTLPSVVGLHWSIFEQDPELKRTVWLGFDDAGNARAAHVEQEVDAILDQNAQTRAFNQGQKWGDYKPTASVPLTLMEKLGLGDAVNSRDRKYISKILNSSDYEKLRTSEGKV